MGHELRKHRNGSSVCFRGLADNETKRQEPLPFKRDTRHLQMVKQL
jgi:hypothetical protein